MKKETICLPLGCLHGGERRGDGEERESEQEEGRAVHVPLIVKTLVYGQEK